ncbi:MAG TPA: efflux RND transporter periplasmic adaptor subunit [Xanthobacteraceae bacterium]|nr:efflux RND transporter periplasmic adaptor subunit [Xanthobacteraceae bacterium]
MDSVTDQALLSTMPVDERPPTLPRVWRGLLLVVVGVLLGIAGDRLIVAPTRISEVTPLPQDTRAAVQPVVSRVGDRIIVPEGSPLRTLLAVAPPTLKEVARTLVLPATVEADPSRTVKVLPPVTGRITELKVQLGGRVVQGQELAVIDSGDLAQAYSDIEKARSTVTLTKKALDRQLNLEKAGGAAIKDREQAQSDYAQAISELERSESRLRAMGIPADQKEQSRLLSVKAPVSGSVIDLQAAPGAFVNDPTAAMMTIANLDTIWVTANVPEKDIAFVFPGQSVKVTYRSYPDDVFEGKVLFVSDVVESDTRRNKVRIAFDNRDKMLKPNMFADASFAAPAMSRLMVPTSALLMTNDATSVFVEVSDWAFERRNVEIAYQEGTAVAIKTGIRPGERVVVKGAVRLND